MNYLEIALCQLSKWRGAFSVAVLLLACGFGFKMAAAPSAFSTSDVEPIKTFLRASFAETNTCMVIGLVDENGRGKFLTAG